MKLIKQIKALSASLRHVLCDPVPPMTCIIKQGHDLHLILNLENVTAVKASGYNQISEYLIEWSNLITILGGGGGVSLANYI